MALQDTDCPVTYPLKLIGRLYRIEHPADARQLTPEEWAELRQERSAPALEKLKRWFVATQMSEPPSTDLAKAAAYALNHWGALTRFVEDGPVSLDNNLCEQQLRDIAPGRKNCLFAGAHDAARRAAALYSLTRTCAPCGVAAAVVLHGRARHAGERVGCRPARGALSASVARAGRRDAERARPVALALTAAGVRSIRPASSPRPIARQPVRHSVGPGR